MRWPFRPTYRPTVLEREMLKATSVRHLATMPGSDVVVGTLFTDPLAPPEDDPEEFYTATPEAAPPRVALARQDPLTRREVARLRTQILARLDVRRHQKAWIAVDRLERWDHLVGLIGREIPTSDGATLTLTRPSSDIFVLVWHCAARDDTRRLPLHRGEDW